MTRELLTIKNLKTYFFTQNGIVRAVDGVSIDIYEKSAVGLVGESGCGKSVTALSVMRLVPSPGKIVDGEILLRNVNLLELSEKEMQHVRGRDISMVFQDPMTYLNPVFKVGDQIAEGMILHQGLTKSEAKKRAIELLENANVPSPKAIAESYPHQLSGGMRQRVLIAMAIACKPSLLIADEPTTALDVTVQAQILEMLKDLICKLKTSKLLITQDLGIVADICERVYVMYAGRIVESANVFALFENPKHPYTIGLLKSVLSIDKFKRKLWYINGAVPSPINFPHGCRFNPRCPQARPICKREEPPIIKLEKQHLIACWLYH